MKTKASIIIYLISCCLFTSEVLGQNSSSTIPFKVLKKPYAWDIKSVTYLGRKNAGYRLRIKGVASRDRDNSYGFSGMSVDVGYYLRNGHQQITGTYFFPPVKKGQPFNVEIVAFLPNGYTLSNIGGFLFTSGFDYEEEKVEIFHQDASFEINAPKYSTKGSRIQLQYILKEKDGQDIQIPNKINGFNLLFGPSVSQNSSTYIVNGKTSNTSHTTYTYILSAEKEGVFTLPAATIKVDGLHYKSGTSQIHVLPPDKSSLLTQPEQQLQTDTSTVAEINPNDAFIRTIMSKTKVKDQDAIEVKFRFYTVLNVKCVDKVNIAEFDGFTCEELELPRNRQMQMDHYKGRNYYTADISKNLLFPRQSGEISIAPMTMDVRFEVPSGRKVQTFFGTQDVMTEVKETLVSPSVAVEIIPPQNSENITLNSSDTMNSFNFRTIASFPGGSEALSTFISDNLVYPTIDQETGIEGKVVVRFIVDSNGKIKNISVTNSISDRIDKEAIRIIKNMPDWNPGTWNGQPVDSYCFVSINFRLDQ